MLKNKEVLKKIQVVVTVTEYVITFEYFTWRGHRRTQSRRIRTLDKSHVKDLFKTWSKTQRAMSNVQILDIAITDNIEKIEL